MADLEKLRFSPILPQIAFKETSLVLPSHKVRLCDSCFLATLSRSQGMLAFYMQPQLLQGGYVKMHDGLINSGMFLFVWDFFFPTSKVS